MKYCRGYRHRSRLGHSHRPWSKSDSHVKVKIKGSRQGQEIPFTQTKIKDRSEINVHWATEPVAGHGQYNVHERALTQVVTAVLAESFGQSEIYSARPVTDSFEQTRMHTVPTT